MFTHPFLKIEFGNLGVCEVVSCTWVAIRLQTVWTRCRRLGCCMHICRTHPSSSFSPGTWVVSSDACNNCCHLDSVEEYAFFLCLPISLIFQCLAFLAYFKAGMDLRIDICAIRRVPAILINSARSLRHLELRGKPSGRIWPNFLTMLSTSTLHLNHFAACFLRRVKIALTFFSGCSPTIQSKE